MPNTIDNKLTPETEAEHVSLRIGVAVLQRDMEYLKKTLDGLGSTWRSDIDKISLAIHELTGLVAQHSSQIQDHESRMKASEDFQKDHKAFHVWFSRTIYGALLGLILLQLANYFLKK